MTPFEGFPEDTFRFLAALARNNRRDWFLERKSDYEGDVRAPMEDFVLAVARKLPTFAPEFTAHPRTSIYRVYRDTRFSSDKSPYKTHIAAVFPHRDLGRHEGAGFYVHIAPGDVFAGGGLYRPLKGDLLAVRQRLSRDHRKFRRVISGARFQKYFGELGGEQLVRVPRGFPPDQAAADLLRYKQFLAGRSFDANVVRSTRFLPEVIATFRALLPMCRFLNEAILSARIPDLMTANRDPDVLRPPRQSKTIHSSDSSSSGKSSNR